MMDVSGSVTNLHVILQILLLWISGSTGVIRCDCNTQECKDAGKTTCMGIKACYTELFQNSLNKGCDPTPLACENRRPAGLDVEWPAVFCCQNKDLCNKHAVPTITKDSNIANRDPEQTEAGHDSKEPQSTDSNCSNTEPQQKAHSGNTTRIINPIYIAVPVAGVCVLLALIIFAMYILRRRTDYHHHHHDSFHQLQHDHLPPLGHKHAVVAPHHCQCACTKPILTTPACSSKGNRCTDSERSSSGSETKLFLQS